MPNRASSVKAEANVGEARRALLPTDGAGRKRARIVLAIGLGLLGVCIGWDFMAPLAWAAVIALAIWQTYQKFTARYSLDRAGVFAPLLVTMAVGIILFIPVALAL